MNSEILKTEAYRNLFECRYSEAERLYKRCVEVSPVEKSNYWYLGLAQLLQDKELEAQDAWFSAIFEETSERSDFWLQDLVAVLRTAARNYQESGYLKQAETIYWQLLQQDETSADVHFNLGVVLAEQGQLTEAIRFYQKAVNIKPNYAEAYCKLGCSLVAQGSFLDALDCHYDAIRIEPENLNSLKYFAICLKHISFSATTAEMTAQVERCFELPDINKNDLLRTASLSLLQLDNEFNQILELAYHHQIDELKVRYQAGELEFIFEKGLLRALLSHTLLTDIKLESLIEILRQFMLEELINEDSMAEDTDYFSQAKFNFLCSLALQCLNNEYILQVSAEEHCQIEQIESDVRDRLLREDLDVSRGLELQLATFGLYFPLSTLARSFKLLEVEADRWSQPIRLLIQRGLQEPQEEQAIKSEIKAITTIENPVSRAVRSQYEENPFPRWIDITQLPPKPISTAIKTLFPHFEVPAELLESPLQILIAGCGTGKEAVTMATACENSQVLAIDISLSSLAYAIRKARELGINNLSFKQADILGLTTLEKQFHIICCGGVIHHLEHPIKGLTVLVDRLKPEGLIRLAIYSKKARKQVIAAQEAVKSRGLQPTAADMKRYRQEIIQSPETDPLKKLMKFQDFFNLSHFRDLVFHAQEHCFTLPQIQQLLEQSGLKFIGFELSHQVATAYRQTCPEDRDMNDLYQWAKFEQAYPDTFASMYCFWCQKAE